VVDIIRCFFRYSRTNDVHVLSSMHTQSKPAFVCSFIDVVSLSSFAACESNLSHDSSANCYYS